MIFSDPTHFLHLHGVLLGLPDPVESSLFQVEDPDNLIFDPAWDLDPSFIMKAVTQPSVFREKRPRT